MELRSCALVSLQGLGTVVKVMVRLRRKSIARIVLAGGGGCRMIRIINVVGDLVGVLHGFLLLRRLL